MLHIGAFGLVLTLFKPIQGISKAQLVIVKAQSRIVKLFSTLSLKGICLELIVFNSIAAGCHYIIYIFHVNRLSAECSHVWDDWCKVLGRQGVGEAKHLIVEQGLASLLLTSFWALQRLSAQIGVVRAHSAFNVTVWSLIRCCPAFCVSLGPGSPFADCVWGLREVPRWLVVSALRLGHSLGQITGYRTRTLFLSTGRILETQ